MAKVAVIGAGFSGHTAAMYLGKHLGKDHEVTVINKEDKFVYVPSLVWVGLGTMRPEKTSFRLQPVYDKLNIHFLQGTAETIHADENYIMVRDARSKEMVRVDYDYLIVATGPKLNFGSTEGLGPDAGNTVSICWTDHAIHARDVYLEHVERMKEGENLRFVVGTGHPSATCQGAAFEYLTNIHKDLVHHGVRHRAELVWLSNERAVGDFGVRGINIKRDGEVQSGQAFMEAIFRDYGIKWEVQKGVTKVDENTIYWEDYEGEKGQIDYDFAMLIPQFTGPSLKFVGKDGEDIAGKITNPGGFIKVDAQYGLDWETLAATPDAWPQHYQNPEYPNIFAAGIAFAPPGTISQPHINPNGMSISAAPPRTGMASAIIGRVVALNIVDLVQGREMSHSERMTEMVTACIASMGNSLWDGAAAVMLIYPVVPNPVEYPDSFGRDPFVTHMEMGLSGAWMKRLIHSTMIHKLKANIGWELIPE